MADSNNIINHVTDFPPMSPTPLTPSIPLRLSGFLTGDAVQVQGDTGDLQFSLQFNFHNKTLDHRENEFVRDSCVQSTPSLSSYLTPTSSTQEILIQSDHNADDANVTSGESWSRGEVVTRLRSGVLSPVKYYGAGSYGACGRSLGCERKKKGKKVRSKEEKVFNKMLRRRSLPLRPCNSYAFFVMANWDVVKCSSFGEKSKRLSKKWFKLPHDIKKEFEHMALKDNERYKRQCVLLRNDPEQEITYGSPAISE